MTIYVSTGKRKVRVPAVKGFSLAQAISTLADADLKANPVAIFNPATTNTVIAQDPAAGKNVVTGTIVRINYSKGLKPVAVPNVVGQTFAAASKRLAAAGFTVTRTDIDSLKPKEQVVAQDPVAGTETQRRARRSLCPSPRDRRSRRSPTSPARTRPTPRRS